MVCVLHPRNLPLSENGPASRYADYRPCHQRTDHDQRQADLPTPTHGDATPGRFEAAPSPRIRIADAEGGGPIGYRRAAVRRLGYIIGGLSFFIGWLWGYSTPAFKLGTTSWRIR